MSGAVHAYVSQSDKGELVIGAGVDGYIGYGQRGSMQVTEQTLGAICELFPLFRRMRMLRQWGGIVDVCPDASPILSKPPLQKLYLNCTRGTRGSHAHPRTGRALPPPTAAPPPAKPV